MVIDDTQSLTGHAQLIWQAGVDAVSSERLVHETLELNDSVLNVASQSFDLRRLSRIVVVGAGKAGAGMVAAVEQVLNSSAIRLVGSECELTGWVNVPADCVRPMPRIHLHAARPAGVNEPTEEGVAGSQKILELVSGLTESDLCLVLLSGGGSALLPAPIEGVSLQDKQTVTRQLMHGGATINEMNCVRKQLSAIKGGALARIKRAGTMVSLIISDVIGDPLDVIASGPTIADSSGPSEALDVLRRIVPDESQVPRSVWDVLNRRTEVHATDVSIDETSVSNVVIGNNSVAVAAAISKASELGYEVIDQGSGQEGVAAEVGQELAEKCLAIRDQTTSNSRPVCVISGGEPVVHFSSDEEPGKGGRNQELVLAACQQLWNEDADRIAILSGGTDGEDGPTDAAGAVLDAKVIDEARRLGLQPAGFLVRHNSYEFFDRAGGLLKTGPTHTNVMDLRVAVVGS